MSYVLCCYHTHVGILSHRGTLAECNTFCTGFMFEIWLADSVDQVVVRIGLDTFETDSQAPQSPIISSPEF